MKKLFAAAAIAASLGIGAPALAADSYVFDKTHTSILFFVNHLGFSKMQGEFLGYDGGFTFDQEDVSKSSIDVTIDLSSVDTDVPKLNDHLKAPDFFDVAMFDKAVFKSTKIEQTGDKTGKVTGDLTLHGETKPVTLDVTFNKAAPHPFKKDIYVAGFEARGVIKRSEFGIKAYIPGVADEVELLIHVEGHRK